MKKGITVDQTALVAAAFRDAGILVHAYLMYGFPSETIQDTIDSLERVRQLFAAELMQSAFWHRFTATAHSPIGLHPASHGLRILGPEFQGFADNDLIHSDRTGDTPDWIGEGLRRSMLNYLERKGLSLDVRRWFDRSTPKPRVSATWAIRLINNRASHDNPKAERRFVWLGGTPVSETQRQRQRLILPGRLHDTTVLLPRDRADWLGDLLQQATPRRNGSTSYPWLRVAAMKFPGNEREFASFLASTQWRNVRMAGLLLV